MARAIRASLSAWPWLLLIAIAAVFVALWGSVLVGRDSLVAGDILRNFPPWSTGGAPQPPRNALVSDPVTQFVPWLTAVREQLLHGQLPLWNPNALAGAPLLANDQSAPFSPFTLVSLPFSPVRGYSLAMLLKIIVAGTGMGLFVRQLRVGLAGAVVGGVAYASSSFMVDWLGHPHTAVAAIFPWAFACLEVWLRTRRRSALAGVALAVALQFLAGHAETSLHLGLLLAFYAVVRVTAQQKARWGAIGGVALAGGLGTLMAGVQLIPFIAELRTSTLLSDRAALSLGSYHLHASALMSWLVPSGRGNPAVDGLAGRYPNYIESTGFIGVGALVLSALGLIWAWRTRRSIALALGAPVILAGAVVYGPLAALAGRLPLLSSSDNERLLVVMCFGLTALAGLGVQAVIETAPRDGIGRAHLARGLVAVGGAAVTGVAALGIVVAVRGGGVDQLFGAVAGNIGFWVLLAALSLLGSGCFVGAWRIGGSPTAAAIGLACLVVVEGAVFAGPFQPRVAQSDVPPPSPAIAWLQANAGDNAVAAQGLDLIPNLASVYGLRDVRGYDVTIDPRVRLYWSHADHGYSDTTLYTQLSRPGSSWLAAAGVRYYVSPPTATPPGTAVVVQAPAFAISEIPGARPFAFAATSVISASSADDAVVKLQGAPLGPIVVEGQPASGAAAPASVSVTRRDPGAVDLDVQASNATTVVVLQSYAPDWQATVDGNAVTVRAADVLFQSVQVAPGQHRVALRYRPASVIQGLLSSAVGILGCVLLGTLPSLSSLRSRRARRAMPARANDRLAAGLGEDARD